MKFPIIELVDRYAIAVVKYEKTNGANLEELAFYSEQMKEINIDLEHELILKLIIHHKHVWALEDDFKKGRIDNKPLEEIGQIAIAVRDMGYERMQIRNAIADLLNDPIKEIKQDHLSAQ
jgi:hypothetical protein